MDGGEWGRKGGRQESRQEGSSYANLVQGLIYISLKF